MKLRVKTLLTIFIVLLISSIVGVFAIYTLVSERFDNIEKTLAEESIEGILKNISKGCNSLNISSKDWGAWDDTYNFIEDQNTEYIEDNFYDNEFVVLQVNAIGLFDSNDKEMFFKSYDYKNNSALATDNEIHNATVSLIKSLKFTSNSEVIHGYFGAENIYNFSAHQIVPSIYTEDSIPRGVIIFVKQIDLDDTLNLGIADVSHVSIKTSKYNASLGLNFSNQKTQFTVTSGNILGTTIINDYYGNPLIILETNYYRIFTTESISLINSIFLVILIILFVLGAFFYLSIDRSIFRKLKKLSDFLEGTLKNPNTDERLTADLGGDFELFKTVLNSLLDKVKEEQNKMTGVNAQLQLRNEELIKERAILDTKNQELNNLNNVMINRELKMIELKKELSKVSTSTTETTT